MLFSKLPIFGKGSEHEKANEYCEHSAVTNSSIFLSRTLCSMLLCALVVLLMQMKEGLPAGTSVSLHQTVGFLFVFESKKTLGYWIMILDWIVGKNRERKWTLTFFNGIFFPLQGEL